MIKKGQYFIGYQSGRPMAVLATDENEHPGERYLPRGWGENCNKSPITVRRMFELLGCPVPEGAKVVECSFGVGFVDNMTLFEYEEYGWQAIGDVGFSHRKLDLSDLPVTEEVIGSLPEPLQKKWKELL